jgi:hypothetical protein
MHSVDSSAVLPMLNCKIQIEAKHSVPIPRIFMGKVYLYNVYVDSLYSQLRMMLKTNVSSCMPDTTVSHCTTKIKLIS